MSTTEKKYIVVTGAAGFIGCNLVHRLNADGYSNLILVDEFDSSAKLNNLNQTQYSKQIDRKDFLNWLEVNANNVDFVFHLGARTDTTEFDFSVLETLNTNYTKALWEVCTQKDIPFLYASSAATYGPGNEGFNDDVSTLKDLKPLNPYGLSKHLLDMFVLEQKRTPSFWVGLKFFNVYGPYEAHKGRMASVIFHSYNQIKSSGKVKLFKSHKPEFRDGEQLRDFIFVGDVVNVCMFFFKNRKNSNIYNLGTGRARTFNDLVNAVFSALHLEPNIEYIPIPEDIRETYQYYTEANESKLISAGYKTPFTTLEEGVRKTVASY